jgi:hypothetical protein
VSFADENLEKFVFANEKDRRAQLNPSDKFSNMPTSINSETTGVIEAERTALLETLTQPIVRLFTDRKHQNTFFMDRDDVQRAIDDIVKSDKAKESMGEGEEVDAEVFESLQRQMNDYSAAAHHLKDPDSLQAIATASPMTNAIRDWYGMLRFIWPEIYKPTTPLIVLPNKKSFAEMADTYRNLYGKDFFWIPEGEKRDAYIHMLESRRHPQADMHVGHRHRLHSSASRMLTIPTTTPG